ncbi:MAG: hypothetical protein JWM47_1388 [Acidimicrobiales bacterium]|nr:hypothetical protein [Acidimicrobiales bacterium]
MHHLAPRRALLAPMAVAMALALAIPAFLPQPTAAEVRTTTAPSITWRLGQTHAVREDLNNRRMTVVIYQRPTRILHQAFREGGIRSVQATLWDRGRPPRFRACPSWGGPCVLQNLSVRLMQVSIFGQAQDLRMALLVAQRQGGCLGLRVIDGGRSVSDWTVERSGCSQGRVQSAPA